MLNEPLIVPFGQADPAMVDRLGAKGAKLVEDFQHIREDFPEMKDAISVPDGFILSTDVWKLYHEAGDRLTDDLFARAWLELVELENREGRLFGDFSGNMPLIVAVRGGSSVSLPGAIGTVLNVGLNDEVVSALIEAGEDEGFVLSIYLTAIRMYGEIVLDIPYERFYEILQHHQAGFEGTLSPTLLRELIRAYKEILDQTSHPLFPSGFETNLTRQLRYCIEAILASWMAPVAVEARRNLKTEVPDDLGTAVIIQNMVFGNRDDLNSLSGVLFTRDLRTGANFPVIEWAPKVQCDKIVSGKLRKELLHTDDLRRIFPDIYDNLLLVRNRFEMRAKRPLDIEFTVENRKLFILQRRPLRMTFNATVRAMWDMVDEGKTNVHLASLVINGALEQSEKVLRDYFEDYTVLAHGEPVTDTAESGILTFGTEEALKLAEEEVDVVLLRRLPYGESDVAVNHPRVRAIIRCDGNATGHEAITAVTYSKPYLINVVDAQGLPLTILQDTKLCLNPESIVSQYIGKKVFVDGERGILGYTEATDFLEDRKSQKKLYVDWEYVREQFDATGYRELNYKTLLDLHYEWELELERYQQIEKKLAEDAPVSDEELLQVFTTYLLYIPERDRERILRLNDIRVDDFDFGPPVVYHGRNLKEEVSKILRALMLCTTWRTHWVHETMVRQARERGESEYDVMRDIFLNNRTMSLVRGFEKEGFHVMKVPDCYYLVFASNFEYDEDMEKTYTGSGTLDYGKKEILAQHFLNYLKEANPELAKKIRMIRGEPPLGQGHARIISIGLSIPDEEFNLACRYLRNFLDQSQSSCPINLESMIPAGEFVDLHQIDPFFIPYPDLKITRETTKTNESAECMLTFGRCLYGEFDGVIYGRDGYQRLMTEVKRFEGFLEKANRDIFVRPWHFEVDPYRGHSVIAAVGIRFSAEGLNELLEILKHFLAQPV